MPNVNGDIMEDADRNITEKRKTVRITAVEDEGEEDVIPGPPEELSGPKRKETSQSRSTKDRLKNLIKRKNSVSTENGSGNNGVNNVDVLQESYTDHKWSGQGILASREDLDLPAEEFAAGCNLLQAAARGDLPTIEKLLKARPKHVNFRDYDRRTALHGE
jgi:hypothetical protein